MTIEQLFKQYGNIVHVEKDHYLFREGDHATQLFFVVNGIVSVCKNAESGKEMALSLSGPGSLIGESNLFCDALFHFTTAKVLQSATLFFLQVTTFESLLNEHPQAMKDYLKFVQNENIKNQSRIRDLLMHGKKGALYSTLIRLANTYGKVCQDNTILIPFPLTNTDIANLCATSREVVNRMLNDLKNRNVIAFDKGYITVLNSAYLKQSIACDHCSAEVCRID